MTSTRTPEDHRPAADAERPGEPGEPVDEGGEAACFAHLVCPDCGVVVGDAAHREGCEFAA